MIEGSCCTGPDGCGRCSIGAWLGGGTRTTIEWYCFRDSSAGPPCDVHIMYVVGRIGVERRGGAIVTVVGYDVCHLPSALLGAPWYRPTRVTRGPHRQRQACPILLTTQAQFRCQSDTERAQFCVPGTCARIPTSELFFWH